jgi:hypothetical protein
VDPDQVFVEKDLGADQTTNPALVGHESMSQEVDGAPIVGASQEDESSGRMRLKVERPAAREGTTRGSPVDARSMATLRGEDIAFRSSLEFIEVGGSEALDDLGLPESVERFDGGLEAGLARRGEDGDDVQREAQPNDAAQSIGSIVGPLEAGVVVELSVGRQAVPPPTLQQSLEDEIGGDVETRPGIDEPAMKGDGVEGVGVARLVAEREIFDDIEGVELDQAIGEIGEIPSRRRRGSTNASSAVEDAVAGEDSSDGANGWQRRDALIVEMAMDGLIAELAEITVEAEMLAGFEDAAFEVGRDASGSRWSAGSVGEVDAIEAFALGSIDPALHGPKTATEPFGGRSKGQTGANQTNDLAAMAKGIAVRVFWPRELSWRNGRLQEM